MAEPRDGYFHPKEKLHSLARRLLAEPSIIPSGITINHERQPVSALAQREQEAA